MAAWTVVTKWASSNFDISVPSKMEFQMKHVSMIDECQAFIDTNTAMAVAAGVTKTTSNGTNNHTTNINNSNANNYNPNCTESPSNSDDKKVPSNFLPPIPGQVAMDRPCTSPPPVRDMQSPSVTPISSAAINHNNSPRVDNKVELQGRTTIVNNNIGGTSNLDELSRGNKNKAKNRPSFPKTVNNRPKVSQNIPYKDKSNKLPPANTLYGIQGRVAVLLGFSG